MMVYCLLVLFAWVAFISAACWLDLSSQEHIERGLDLSSQKHIESELE